MGKGPRDDLGGRSAIGRMTMGTDPMDELEIRLNELRSYGLFAPSAIRKMTRTANRAVARRRAGPANLESTTGARQ